MLPEKRKHPKIKSKLHPRSKHRERYDFEKLVEKCPELEEYVYYNKFKDLSIDFFDPDSVKTLNKSLLKFYYGIEYWDIFPNYLCPPVPGRADYIHYIADLLGSSNNGTIPKGRRVQCLDIGVGANCIYPMVGYKEYGWSFIGCDIDATAIKSAKNIIKANPVLKGKIECRWQSDPNDIFYGVLDRSERIDVSICNPPFHSSSEEVRAGTIRKLRSLSKKSHNEPILNFGGQQRELWCEGGEKRFIKDMIFQSSHFSKSCLWFTTLVSKESNLETFHKALKKVKALEVRIIPMGQGNKKSRILAWTFLKEEQHAKWMARKWDKDFKDSEWKYEPKPKKP
ncbi:MAG: 23S rRNA (adenine(1618)-N(6))-methyltransferase RlmF [Chitinophagales bacterium]